MNWNCKKLRIKLQDLGIEIASIKLELKQKMEEVEEGKKAPHST